MTSKTQTTKVKPDKRDYIKLKTFAIAKETNDRVKRLCMEWEKIFGNHISDNGLKFKIQLEAEQYGGEGLPSKHSLTEILI